MSSSSEAYEIRQRDREIERQRNTEIFSPFLHLSISLSLYLSVSNNGPVCDRRTFRDDDDAFADVVVVAVVVFISGFVQYPHVRPNAHVFINDGFADDGVFADADPGESMLAVIGQLLQRLVIIGAHHQSVFDFRAAFDARADADHRVADLDAV